jgi:hypothetical protein
VALKTIETRAVISAQDKTGTTFAQVAQKLKGMEAAAAHVSRRMDSVARGMSAVGVAQQRHADIARRMSSVGPVLSGGGFLGMTAAQRERALQTAAQAGVAVAMTAPIVKKVVQQSSARIHENLRMATAGMTPAEIADAQEQMSKLSREFKQTPSTDIGAMLRNARTVVGAYEEAVKIADPMLKLGTVLRHVNKNLGDEQVTQEMESLIRAADLAGATKNIGAFKTYIEGIGKALNVFGDSVQPRSYFEAAQKAGGAVTQYSQDFISGVMPSLIQTMGGPAAGTSLGTFFSALIGGKMRNKSAKILGELGLLDPTKVLWNKTGDVKGVMPGGIRGTDLALTNPYEWAIKYVLPALTKKGIAEPGQITNYLAAAFSDRRAGALVTHMILNRSQIDRDIALGKGGMGLDDAVKKISREDPGLVWRGLVNSAGELGRVLGKDVTPVVTKFGDRLGDIVGTTSAYLDKNALARGGAIVGGGLATTLAAHLGLSAVGGYFGGAGLGSALSKLAPLGRVAGPAGALASIGAFGYDMYGNYRQMSAMLDRGDAMMKQKAEIIDRSPEALAKRAALRDMTSAQSLGFSSGFTASRKNWARGDAAGSVAPGALAFGFGEFGVNQRAAAGETYSASAGVLRRAPRNLAAEEKSTAAALADALRSAPPQKFDVHVTADPMKIETTTRVEASSDLLRVVDGAKTAAREARLSAKASGPGTTGSTDFGNQH